MIRSKGIFPYNAATSRQQLEKIQSLPPIWEGVKQEDYDNALKMWQDQACQSLKDYMMTYLKLDVFLLADVFEAFRLKTYEEDGLEALRFFSIPGLSWASAIKGLRQPLELITDAEMYKFFEGGIRGGMTFVNKHHVQSSADTELLYIDINNLYGYAMSQKLPCGDFKWIDTEIEQNEVIEMCKNSNEKFDGERGYVLEVDLNIPVHIMDKLDDLPVAPESQCPPGSKVKKLLLTHTPKQNYVVHCRLLQRWLTLGVEVEGIHRIISFKQSHVFEPYVRSNTEKRARATNEFERDYYKLKNNSLYGKTVENLKKRRNLRLCNNPRKLITYSSSPFFRKSIKIADDLIALFMCKENICLDRPSYIGQVILDLSKLRMYDLQYVELQKYRELFSCDINIVAGDTDSFFLECRNVSLRNQLLPQMLADGLLDTSKYPSTDALYSSKFADVVGKFKDESKGVPYDEWVFLRPKCYSLSSGIKSTIKAKGVDLKDSSLKHESYLKVYNDDSSITIDQMRIQSKNHQLYTIKSRKLALRCQDDKRHWVGKNKSHAYGHYALRDS
jgi:hypothetical protein